MRITWPLYHFLRHLQSNVDVDIAGLGYVGREGRDVSSRHLNNPLGQVQLVPGESLPGVLQVVAGNQAGGSE